MPVTYTFLTGRERTLNIQGTFAGQAYNNNLYGSVSPIYVMGKQPTATVQVLGVSITALTGVYYGQEPRQLPREARIGEKVSITLPGGLGTSDHHAYQLYRSPAPYTGVLDGTWSVTATLQECVSVEVADPASRDFMPPFTKLTFYERIKPGSTISASASCGQASTSIQAQVPLDSSIPVVASYGVFSATVFAQHDDPDAVWACTAQITWTYPSGTGVDDPSFSRSMTQSGARSYQCTVSSNSLNLQAQLNATHSPNIVQASATASLYGPKEADVQFQVASMDSAYNQPLTASLYYKKNTTTDVTINNGSGGYTITQRRWTVTASFDGAVQSDVRDDWDFVYAWLPTSSLQAIGEDPNATRLLGRGWRFEGIRLKHETRTVLDTCSVVSNTQRQWSAIQNCTVSVDSGSIRVTPTGSTPIVARTMLNPDKERWESYAYLRTRVKSSVANATIKLIVGSKQWVKNTGVPADTWVEIYWDLCAPTNVSASYDLQTTGYPEGSVDGPYWGVKETSELRLELQQADWWIDEISLDVYPWQSRPSPWNKPNHSVHVLPSMGYWVTRQTNHEIRRLITGQSDGKQALEIEDVAVINNIIYQRSIQWVADEINSAPNGVVRWPGWTATIRAPEVPQGGGILPIRDGYLNRASPATWLNGAGLMYGTNGWELKGGRIELQTQEQDIFAQALYDQIDWYPRIGDVWGFNTGNVGGPLMIRFGVVLRGRAFGLALDQQKNRIPEGLVLLERMDIAEPGGSSTLMEGFLETGAPYAKGQKQYRMYGASPLAVYETSRLYYTRLPIRTVTTGFVSTPTVYFVQETPVGEQVVELFVGDSGSVSRTVKFRFGGYGLPSGVSYEQTGTLNLTEASEKPLAIGVMSPGQIYLWTYTASSGVLRLYLLVLSGYGGTFNVVATLLGSATSYPSNFPVMMRHSLVVSPPLPGLIPAAGEWTYATLRTTPAPTAYYVIDTAPNFSPAPTEHFYNPYCKLCVAASGGNPGKIALWRESSLGDSSGAIRLVLLGVLSDFSSTVQNVAGAIVAGKLLLFFKEGSQAKLRTYTLIPTPPVGQIDTSSMTQNVISTEGEVRCIAREGSLLLYAATETNITKVYNLAGRLPPYEIMPY